MAASMTPMEDAMRKKASLGSLITIWMSDTWFLDHRFAAADVTRNIQ